MRIKPVRNYQNPDVPTKSQDSSKFVLKFIPKRWLKNAVVAGAFCSFLSFGCEDTKIEPKPEQNKPDIPTQTSQQSPATDAQENIKFYKVAPIFSYSITRDSRAMLSPTALTIRNLTEEDARKIIIDEAKKYGLNFATDGELPTISGIDFLKDESDKITPKPDAQTPDEPAKSRIFVFDGFDKDKRIAFEVITAQDIDHKNTRKFNSFNLKEAVQELREVILTKQGDYTVGIFFDPEMINYPIGLLAEESNVGELLLRAQVQEFILWLAQNNLIELGKP